MRYLNNLVNNLQQVKKTFVPQRELFIARGTKMGTVSIGYAELNGEKIYIAKKIPKAEKTDLQKKFLTDLWFIDSLAEYDLPEFESQFPLVYGIQLDSQGKPQSIITEDYTQRNKHTLFTPEWNELHPCVPNKVQTENFDMEEFARVGFRVGQDGPIRLGDFDTHANPNVKRYEPFLEKLAFNYKA